MASPLETYIQALYHNRSLGVPETSYYGALQAFVDSVGKELSPKVWMVLHPSVGGGILPDGGLFSSDQGKSPPPGTPPSRGVVEIKGTKPDVHAIAATEQVKKYLARFNQVLVTNYRSFLLLTAGPDGAPVELEEYHLAPDEATFWKEAAKPASLAAEHAVRLTEYLKRVMLRPATLTDPRDLAWFLASYARDGQDRIERAALPALASIRSALEEALGLKFEGPKGEHFFRSTMIQTLFYGLFSAWVLWHNQKPARTDRFDWRTAVWLLHVPMIQTLFAQVATPQNLTPLNLVEVLDWTGDTLNRVDRQAFFDKFDDGQTVQYFYEPFLEAFDPQLRKDLGVWYTPPEIVRYMVERVDRVLREELNIPAGLADPGVYVLDPCTGTGSYLVEVLRRIDQTLKEQGADALGGNDLKQAATSRVFGFEILPAPFVVAHLQLGLLLQKQGAPLGGNERVGVYLTNALTGWQPPTGPKNQLTFPEMQQERDAAEQVKREKPILVVLGNPPYNAFAGTSPVEEGGLVEPYKDGLRSEWGILAGSMHDLYIRFFRLAERRIAETNQPGRGIICYISNASYLSEPSFVVMRQRFLKEFDTLWFDNMNGDSRETGKLTPEGKPDPSVFSTQYNREGIRVGTTIGLMVRKAKRTSEPSVYYRQFWGTTKRADLLESLKNSNFYSQYKQSNPTRFNRYSFRPLDVKDHYQEWPKLVDLSYIASYPGMDEDRRFALISTDKDQLTERMKAYYDKEVPWSDVLALHKGFGVENSSFSGPKVRARLLVESHYDNSRIIPYVFRPFDLRWCYYEPLGGLWHRPSPERANQVWEGNSFLISRPAKKTDPEGVCFYITSALSARDMLIGHGNCIPIFLRSNPAKKQNGNGAQGSFDFGEDKAAVRANLSEKARAYLAGLRITNPDGDSEAAALLWRHALAIGYAPAYLEENADGIRQDWPRIPLPNSRELLESSARLGQQIAALLDTETARPGLTAGTIEPLYRLVGSATSAKGGQLQPQQGDLELRAGWGHAGKEGVTMPGKGRLEIRDYSPTELEAIEKQAAQLGLTREEALARLGPQTCDIYLNKVAYWKNVPLRAWEYTIGGYQVIKKWLSYREYDLLGRSLSAEEVREVQNMARRLTALLLLEPHLDTNYQASKAAAYPWPTAEVKE